MSRPLLLRPGARYECHGDGTCCTNIHLLGPLTRREAKVVRKHAHIALPLFRGRVVEKPDDELMLRTRDARCVFLDHQARCRFHANVGEERKPEVCRRFPVGASTTPRGIRVSLSHRCPCVSVGESRPLDEARARSILADPDADRIATDLKVGKRMSWRARRRITFDAYVEWESVLIERLDGKGPHPRIERVLRMDGCDTLPALRGETWRGMAKRMRRWCADEPEEDGFFCTVRWVASVLSPRARDAKRDAPKRPWTWTLERTASRLVSRTPTRTIYGSWLADVVWSLSWTDHSVYEAMADLTARYVVAKRLADEMRRRGATADLAAAEAIMIVDTVSASEVWGWVQESLMEAPAGTF